MSDATPQTGPTGAAPAGPPATLKVVAQYLKDLSFENPRAPASFSETQPAQFDIDVNVNGRGIGPNQYEVELSVQARCRRERDVVFVVEATYAGAFEIQNVGPEHLEIFMLVECPSLLFPYMRQILSDATRNGNYPPLMLEPIDFFAVYQANQARARAQGAAQQQAAAQPAHA